MSKLTHAPCHKFSESGTYIVTGATLYKEHFFRDAKHLDRLQELLIELSYKYGWRLEAWAVFSNHYHFVAHSPSVASNMPKFIRHLHGTSARELNKKQNSIGREVWYQYWDTRITYYTSYLARLNYVMNNPVKHKLVECAKDYPWCSANWFAKQADPQHKDLVMGFNTDSVNIRDDY